MLVVSASSHTSFDTDVFLWHALVSPFGRLADSVRVSGELSDIRVTRRRREGKDQQKGKKKRRLRRPDCPQASFSWRCTLASETSGRGLRAVSPSVLQAKPLRRHRHRSTKQTQRRGTEGCEALAQTAEKRSPFPSLPSGQESDSYVVEVS